jgi:hypothetical protein
MSGGGQVRTAAWATPLLLAAALVDFLRLAGPQRPQIDDAYISYRYAANWIAGHGLVWNPGEWVEGFSNPLWTLATACAMRLGADPRSFGHALGVAGGVGTLIATWLLARALLPPERRALAALAVWPVSASVALVHWSTAGLETSLFVAFETAALACWLHTRLTAGLVFLLLGTATRLDGALLAAVLLGFHVLPGWRSGDRSVWRPLLVYTAAVAASFALRFVYYDALLPNTYWAKVGGVPLWMGLGYLRGFFAAGPVFLLPLAGLAIARDRRTWPAAVFALSVVVYVLRVGGDAFPHGRFLLPLLPVLSALAVAGLSRAFDLRPALAFALAPSLGITVVWSIWGRLSPALAAALFAGTALAWLAWRQRPRPARIAAAGSVFALGLVLVLRAGGPFTESPRERSLQREWRLAAHGEAEQQRRAELLATRERPHLVAAGAIGAFGYYSGLPVLDLLGLVDAHIARSRVPASAKGLAVPGHSRSDADYVLAREPDYILIPRKDSLDSWVYAIRDLWAHPGLEQHYVWDAELAGYRRTGPDGPALGGGSSRGR